MSVTFLELFAGAGGLSRGLEAGGLHCIGHAEIEPHARAVLRFRYPDVPLYGDVTQVTGADTGPCDLVSFGAPCQDLSVAGKRAGLMGARSSLFFDGVRLWNETGATYALYENVMGALSSNDGKDFAAVLSTLVGSTVAVPADGWRGGGGVVAGRDAVAAWRVLDLQHFGPPQRRVRVFILAARAGGVDPAEVLALSEGVCGHPSPRQQSREGAAARVGGGAESGVMAFDSYNQAASHVTGFLSHGESGKPIAWDNELNASTEAQSYGINNDSCAEVVVEGIASLRAGQRQQPAVLAFHHTQDPISGEVSPAIGRTTDGMGVLAFSLMPQNSGKDYTGREVEVLQPLHTGGTGAASNQGGDVIVCTTGDITHALTHEGADASEDGTGRGTPIVAYGRGAFGGWDGQEVTAPVCTHDAKETTSIVVEAVLPTLAMGADTAAPGSNGQGALQYADAMTRAQGRPRRLTPLECERLMSWPDQWTATGVKDDGTEYALSDTARYRLCGNGVGSVCAEWIGRRLMAAITAQVAA